MNPSTTPIQDATSVQPINPTTKTRVAKASVTVNGEVLTWKFANGQTLSVDSSILSHAIRDRAIVHGIEQKIRDSYAGSKTVDEAYSAANEVAKHLYAGEWNVRAEAQVVDYSLVGQAVIMALLKENEALAAAGQTQKKISSLEVTVNRLQQMDVALLKTIIASPGVAVQLAALKAKGKADASLDVFTE